MLLIQRLQQQDVSRLSLLAIALVVVFGIGNFLGLQSLFETTKIVKHTEEATSKAAQIEKLVVDLVAGQRGFLITGAEEYLQPYHFSRQELHSALTELKGYVSNNPEQYRRIERIDELIRQWLEEAGSREIAQRRKVKEGAKDAAYLQEVLRRGVGKKILDNIRQDLPKMDLAFAKAENHKARTMVLLIAKDMVEMESGQRGFLVTGRDEFLEPFYQGQDQLGVHIAGLYHLIDNSFDIQQLRKWNKSLQLHHSDWQKKSAEPLIELRIAVDNDLATRKKLFSRLQARDGQATFSIMRHLLDEMQAEFSRSDHIKALELIALIDKSLYSQQSGLRGFVITGDNDFLTSYNDGESTFNEHLFQLQTLAINAFDRSLIQRKLSAVANQSQQWMDKSAEPEMAAREEMNVGKTTMEDITQLIKSGTGKRLMDKLRKEFLLFKSTEGNLLIEREKEFEQTSSLMIWMVSGSTVLMVVFSLALMRTANVLRKKTRDVEVEQKKLVEQDWVKSSIVNISESIQNEKSLEDFADVLLAELCPLIGAQVGLFYLRTQDQDEVQLQLLASVAHIQRKHLANTFKLGESLVGQCALEQKQIILSDIPDDYIKVGSGIGEATPKALLVFPIVFESRILAVIEVAAMTTFSHLHLLLIQQLQQSLGVITNNVTTQQKTVRLLSDSQRQAQLLADNQYSLEEANKALANKTERLERSEEELKQQSEELRVSNEELTEKQSALEVQKRNLEKAKGEIEVKADELAQSSKYKSEFLANMSHELRTPLNSLLILSKLLMQNKTGNLTSHQCEDLKVIHDGGNDLLNLINDIMDLSKVEAGMLSVHFESVGLKSIKQNIFTLFKHIAEEKGLNFQCVIDENLPENIHSDGQRLEQILKNFLSNAFKFTAAGDVTLSIHCVADDVRFSHSKLSPISSVAFTVKDSGVGIAPDKQQAIFEAFQQEDGSTSRQYGGTGLGLAISKELASLLGGEISLISEQGKGSQFTLYVPLQHQQSGSSDQCMAEHKPDKDVQPLLVAPSEVDLEHENEVLDDPVHIIFSTFIEDDRRNITDDDKVLLLVEDDKIFAKILRDLARENQYKCLVTDQGRQALYLAQEYKPMAILLDVGLPDIDGLKVLDQLKYNLHTRHIPVHIVSGNDCQDVSLKRGAYRFLKKPIDADALGHIFEGISRFQDAGKKDILVVEGDEASQQLIESLIAYKQVQFHFVNTGAEALECLEKEHYDCVILELNLPDISGVEVLEQMAEKTTQPLPPVIIYTDQEISTELEQHLNQLSRGIIIKGAESSERLLDEVSLFLHSVSSQLPEVLQEKISVLHDEDAMLQGRKVLIVDDDMRNVFALSRQLEQVGIDICMADNGQVALDVLNERDDIELVLMDIMMPVMDGHEACREIRKNPRYQDLPIIALTAKAMPEDREKCLQAGASEYLTKPLDLNKLLSMLRVWLYKHE